MICLATPRLLLRTWHADDRADLDALLADHVGATGNLEQSQIEATSVDPIVALDAAWTADGYGVFALEALDGGRLLGLAGLVPESSDGQTLELLWRVNAANSTTSECADQGESLGIAIEALTAVIDWAFGLLDLSAVSAIVAVDNAAASAAAETVGMTLVSRTIDPATTSWLNRYSITLAVWNEETR